MRAPAGACRRSARGDGLSVTVGQHGDAFDVALGFLVRRDTAMTIHRALARVVAGGGQGQVAVEALQQPGQVLRAAADVLRGVVGIVL